MQVCHNHLDDRGSIPSLRINHSRLSSSKRNGVGVYWLQGSLIDAFFDLIANSLVDGQDVKISGFGNFQIRTKAPRPGRNPRTGEAIPIEARRVVTFHASHKLKDQIQGEVRSAPGPGALD